jgi:hypothetical protein
MDVVAIVLIVSEWGEPEIWPAIIAFLGLLTATCVGWYFVWKPDLPGALG